MHVLSSILGFVLAIGLLVAVHEWGHFWVARRLGVKVLRFSIGFGRPLRTWRGAETEYVIAALPLGGYVKMLDGREGPLDPVEAHRAFDRQSVARRAAIVAAGPAANLVFAVLAYMAMYMVGVQGFAPLLGDPEAQTPAALAGVLAEDRVLAVNQRPVGSFDAMRLAVFEAAAKDDPVRLELQPAAGGPSRVVELPGAPYGLFASAEDPLLRLGLRPWEPVAPIVVRRVEADGAAESSGLRVGDVVLAVNGEALEDARVLVETIRNHPGERIRFDLNRAGQPVSLVLIPATRSQGGAVTGYVGAAFGLDIDPALRERLLVMERMGPLDALLAGLDKTVAMSVLSLRVMGMMLTGEASLETISGPLGIADVAGRSLVVGVSSFLGFLALVSLSLAILNLLPVPVLDGGHLLFYLIEALRGRPLPEQVQAVGQRVGMSLLFALMMLAMFNDLSRLFG
ncbi:MAG: RIP metalloprotease RseP [Pseudomonadota bacterium]